MQRHQRGAGASRQPPVGTGRLKFRADLLLRFARYTGPRFQLYENWFPTPDDQLIREAAPHTPVLLKDTAQSRDRLVLQ
jgi:hypothetical protein